MKVCPQCGEENPERFRLCGFCGTPFRSAEAPQEVRKTVTVVFTDLVGSTSLGDSMDSESLREVLHRYFESMQAVLELHGGAVEKFIGDAIMAVFGLPKLREDDALRAVKSALGMRAALASLNEELERGWGVVLANRTGVNTGEVVAGDVTAGQRLVTGDAVNVAARLEQAAGSGEILLGDLTYQLVRRSVDVEPVEQLTLKGKPEPVPAYRVLELVEEPAPARRHEGPLIGRERELGSLLESFEEAVAESRPRLATILGSPGMGKSRLVEELITSVCAKASVVRGRCLSHGRGITFWPVVEIVRQAAGILEEDPPQTAREKIGALAGDDSVAGRVASTVGLSNVEFAVEETFWGVRKLFESMAVTRPLVVVFEDIHWAETTMLDLIAHVLATAERPILLVGLARHELLDLRPDWVGLPRSLAVALEPLSADDAALLADQALGEAALDPEVRRRIVEVADGNPLFVQQMLSKLVDEGALRREGDRWVTVSGVTEISVPPTIHALLSARLDLLGPEERAVIEAAAVAGLVFPEDALRELVSAGVAARLESLLGALARKHLVQKEHEHTGAEVRFRFTHALVREAAYGGMLKRTRATLHERFVDWADRVNADRDRAVEFEEILGYHLEQAYTNLSELGPLDDYGRELGKRAAARLSSAGRRAFARGDMPAAANLLRRAVTLLPEHDPARLELLPDLGEALMDIGEFAWAEIFLEEALEGSRDDDPVRAKAELGLLLVRAHSGAAEGWSEQIVAAAERAIPLFDGTGDDAGLATAYRRLAWAHGTACRYGLSAQAAEQAVEHARRAGDARQGRRAASQYALAALHGPTAVREAIAHCEQIASEARGDHRTEGLVRSVLAALYAMQGDVDEARRTYREAQAMLAELGATVVGASTSLASYSVEVLAGDLAAAERELRRDYEILEEMNERYLRSTVAAELARVVYAGDRVDEADALTVDVQTLADEGDIVSQTLWRSVRAKVLAVRGQIAEALDLAHEAVELIGQTDANVIRAEALADRAEVLRAAGHTAEADGAVAEAAALLAAKGSAFASLERLDPASLAVHEAVVPVHESPDPVSVGKPLDSGQTG